MLSGRSPRPQSNLRWSLTAGGGRRNEVSGSAARCSCGNCRRARCRRALRLDAGRRTVKLTDGFARWASGSAVPRQALPGFRGESRGLLQCGVDSLRSVRATWVCRVSGCYCAVDRAIWSGSQMFGNLAFTNAGWSSSVARWAHNPEVAGSNPVPATSGDGPQAQAGGPFSCGLATLWGTFATLMTRWERHRATAASIRFGSGGAPSCSRPLRNVPSASDGPVLDRDVVHGKVGGVACRQARIDAGGRRGDQAVGLVKGDPAFGELAAPASSANSFGRAQRCTP